MGVPMKGRKVSCVSLFLLAAATASPSSASPSEGVATRDAMVRFAHALDSATTDPALSASLKRGAGLLQAMSADDADRIFRQADGAAALDSATRSLKAAVASQAKDIEFPQPDVEPSNCANMTSSTALGLLIAKASAEDVIAAAKWVCHQTELGENGALACLAPELIANAAKAAFESAEFCLGEKRSANGQATRETIVNIGNTLLPYCSW